jgi:hypothetical protein
VLDLENEVELNFDAILSCSGTASCAGYTEGLSRYDYGLWSASAVESIAPHTADEVSRSSACSSVIAIRRNTYARSSTSELC